LADHATPLKAAFAEYVEAVAAGRYPAAEHEYVMPPAEKQQFLGRAPQEAGATPNQ
jgi:hypothetical protein